MRRRELLQAVGLGAMVDLASIADGAAVSPAAAAQRAILGRLPAFEQVGPYDVVLAREMRDERLLEPDLLGDARAHLGVVTADVAASIAIGYQSESDVRAMLRDRGFDDRVEIDDGSAYLRRDRYSVTGAVISGEAVAIGTAGIAAELLSLLRPIGAADTHTGPVAGDHAVDRALGALGEGTVISISPQAGTDLETSDGPEPAPIVTGGRLTIGESVLDCREVSVYESASARQQAERAREEGSRRRITADGELLVTDQLLDRSDVALGRR